MWKKLGFLGPIVLLTATSCNETVAVAPLVIKNVIDGDTVAFQSRITGRLFGIDTPELKNKHGSKTTGVERLMALKAKQVLARLLAMHPVTIIRIKTDKFNRAVVKLQSPSGDIGIKMVRLGLARVAYISTKPRSKFFSPDQKYYQQLLEAQYDAYVHNVGIWGRKDLYKKIFPKKA